MFKKWKWLMMSIVLLFPVQVIATSLTNDDPETEISDIQEELANETLRYSSNQFTQPEKQEGSVDGITSLEGYEFVAESEELELYVEETSLALKIVDKRSGYVWNSGLLEEEEYNLNDTWRNMAHSAITINYVDTKGNSHSESILTNDSVTNITRVEDGFAATITFDKSKITIPLEVKLVDSDSLEVYIPIEGIEEADNKLTSLRAYPFLGSVHDAEKSGYFFIPDGSGALIRFQEQKIGGRSPYRAFVYGEDEGFKRSRQNTDSRVNDVLEVTMPVYGVVHGVKENAYFTRIEEGQSFSEIMAYPSGASTDFYWITNQYHYRYQYYQPTSQKMSGYNVFQEEMNEFNVRERMTFLTGQDADYVGMALEYQHYLVEEGILDKGIDEVDLRLEFLGSEVKRGLLWNSVHVMTEVNDIPEHVNKLQEQDVNNFHIVYRGWSKGGLTATLPERFPLERKLGAKRDFQEVNQYFEDENIPFYYHTDYTRAYEGSSGFSGRSDVARKINAETIGSAGNTRKYYFLTPLKSLEIAKKDIENYNEYGISHLAIDTSAKTLFSDFNKGQSSTRPEVRDIYREMTETLKTGVGQLALYQPNDYMWSYMDRYLDIPMYSSNYRFVTDTVPFIHIVLKGYVPYYAPFSNFYHNSEEEVLRMIEFGAYPSFYLTTNPSYLLMKTPSSELYTSQFSDWEDEIIKQYKMVQDSLGQVEGETIQSRHIHETGVVEVRYSNGKSILINYTNQPVDIEGIEIEAKGFKVVDWGIQS